MTQLSTSMTTLILVIVFSFSIVKVAAAMAALKPREHLKPGEDVQKEPIEIAIERLKDQVNDESIETDDEHQARDQTSDEENTRHSISVEDAKKRVTGMKDYLLSIASTPFSEALPLPHLDCHQTYLLFGGCLHSFKKLETIIFGTE